MPLKIAVIGAGISGLCALRHLANDTDQFAPTCFERLDVEGGLWNYSDETGNDKYGYPLPYGLPKSLITNLPKQLMSFSGLEHALDTPTYMRHPTVKRYIAEYSEKFQLRKYIKFQTMVTRVEPIGTQENRSWSISVRDLETGDISTSVFDAVMVCSGHNQFPYSTDLPGLAQFQGKQVHSKDYRSPDEAENKNVLVVGASVSAWEIIDDIRGHAKNIYVVGQPNSIINMDTLEGVENVEAIKEVVPEGIELESGEKKAVDIIYLATGFAYKFPFLAPECGLETNASRISPLYRHMITIKNPSFIFIGYLKRTIQFPLTEVQVLYACALLKRQFQLPTEDEMLRWEEEDYQKRTASHGLPDRNAQVLFGAGWIDYIDEAEKEAKLQFTNESTKKLGLIIFDLFAKNVMVIRKYNYRQANGEWLAELQN